MKELSRVLAAWPSVWRLEMTGNTLCHKKKYRDRVIVMSRSLGKWFLVTFDKKKEKLKKKFFIFFKNIE